MRFKQFIGEKIVKPLEFPQELVFPKVTILSDKEITVENYKGIIEYEENLLRINTEVFIIKIEGAGLLIKNINDDELIINGRVKNIEFLY